MTPESVNRLLPAIFESAWESGSPLDALLRVMAELHSSVEKSAAAFPSRLAAWETSPEFVPLLQRWVGLEPGTAVDEFHARQLLTQAAGLWRVRGTATGIVRMLELSTGIGGFRVQSGEEPFTLLVRAPREARFQEARVRRIVGAMKPAAVRFVGLRYPEEGT